MKKHMLCKIAILVAVMAVGSAGIATDALARGGGGGRGGAFGGGHFGGMSGRPFGSGMRAGQFGMRAGQFGVRAGQFGSGMRAGQFGVRAGQFGSRVRAGHFRSRAAVLGGAPYYGYGYGYGYYDGSNYSDSTVAPDEQPTYPTGIAPNEQPTYPASAMRCRSPERSTAPSRRPGHTSA